jgi:hypothetical protein
VKSAIRLNLAIELQPYFPTGQINPALVAGAERAKRLMAVQSLNSRAVPGRIKSAAQPRPPQA